MSRPIYPVNAVDAIPVHILCRPVTRLGHSLQLLRVGGPRRGSQQLIRHDLAGAMYFVGSHKASSASGAKCSVTEDTSLSVSRDDLLPSNAATHVWYTMSFASCRTETART